MPTQSDYPPTKFDVVIIGGGFSGTNLATHLLRRTQFSVAVIEKTATVGCGLAYGTACRSHLLNVCARNMSVFADDPHHFFRWLLVDRVINCTGPEGDFRRVNDPLVTSLLAQGIAQPDPLFLGLDVSLDGALIAGDGSTSKTIYTIGPSRKGRLWESTAVPEIRDQVDKLVTHLLAAPVEDTTIECSDQIRRH